LRVDGTASPLVERIAASRDLTLNSQPSTLPKLTADPVNVSGLDATDFLHPAIADSLENSLRKNAFSRNIEFESKNRSFLFTEASMVFSATTRTA